jgi:hypothetical protein
MEIDDPYDAEGGDKRFCSDCIGEAYLKESSKLGEFHLHRLAP